MCSCNAYYLMQRKEIGQRRTWLCLALKNGHSRVAESACRPMSILPPHSIEQKGLSSYNPKTATETAVQTAVWPLSGLSTHNQWLRLCMKHRFNTPLQQGCILAKLGIRIGTCVPAANLKVLFASFRGSPGAVKQWTFEWSPEALILSLGCV